MKKFKVKTPENFNGVFHECKFVDGEHICDNEHKVKIFKDWGFEVEEIVEDAPNQKKRKQRSKEVV